MYFGTGAAGGSDAAGAPVGNGDGTACGASFFWSPVGLVFHLKMSLGQSWVNSSYELYVPILIHPALPFLFSTSNTMMLLPSPPMSLTRSRYSRWSILSTPE